MNPGKFLILAGLLATLLGIFLLLADKLPFIGRLPGDIRIEREQYSFYFPLGSCLLFSVLLSLLLWIFRR